MSPPEPVPFRYRILVVDDDAGTREAVTALLEARGWEVEAAASAEAALDRLRQASFHLALIDQRLPGMTGTELASRLAEDAPMTGVVLITGHGSLPHAVEAMKLGALDYVAKPLDASKLEQVVRAALAGRPRWVPNRLLAGGRGPVSFDGMVARSASMRAVFERILLAASETGPVLVTGESGSGKERIARSVHRHSARGAGPFAAVVAGSLPPESVAPELFGHEAGAFAGATAAGEGRLERAAGGTVFLDEVETLDARAQLHLLRVIERLRNVRVGGGEERPCDVRVIAGTSANLAAKVAEGELRADLFGRLAAFTIDVPPLRRRPEDIAPLAAAFLQEFAARHGRPVLLLEERTLRLLESHPWPGNVRELRNAIEQAATVAQGKRLLPDSLPAMLRPKAMPEDSIRIRLNTPLRDVERLVILRTLEANGGNEASTARALGISRRTLHDRLRRYVRETPADVDGADPGG